MDWLMLTLKITIWIAGATAIIRMIKKNGFRESLGHRNKFTKIASIILAVLVVFIILLILIAAGSK